MYNVRVSMLLAILAGVLNFACYGVLEMGITVLLVAFPLIVAFYYTTDWLFNGIKTW